MEIVIEASIASTVSEPFELTQSLIEPQTKDMRDRPVVEPIEAMVKPLQLDRRESNVRASIAQSVELPVIADAPLRLAIKRRVETIDESDLLPPELDQPHRKPRQAPSIASAPIAVPQPEDAGIDASPLPEPLVTNLPPKYPASELQNGIEGRAMLRLTIESRGTVSAVEIETSSGSDALDRAAMQAVIHWKFQPWGTSTVSSSRTIHAPIVFKLKNSR